MSGRTRWGLLAIVVLAAFTGWTFERWLVFGRSIEGRVLVNGAPCVGAVVYFMPDGIPQGRTSSDGSFTLDVLWGVPWDAQHHDLYLFVDELDGGRPPLGGIELPPWWERLDGFDVDLAALPR